MGKIFWQISTTLDGYMERPNGELDLTAQVIDNDFEKYASEMLNSIEAIVLGRMTYELFVDYWPTAEGRDAERMNTLPKIVFSKTLDKVLWQNARLAGGDLRSEIHAVKTKFAGDIAVFGSAGLASSLINLGLIDEYRLLITPHILGSGGKTFKEIVSSVPLRLARADRWSSGTMALYYEPA